MKLNRRKALKNIGTAALIGGSGIFASDCVTAPPTNSSISGYKGPGYMKWNFYQSIHDGWTPGITFILPGRTPIVAMAKGVVVEFGKHRMSGHAGGYYIGRRHSDVPKGVWAPMHPFHTFYFHLSKTDLRAPDKVERGDIVGYSLDGGGVLDQAKFSMRENGNLVNPLNYGPRHGNLVHWDGTDRFDRPGIEDRHKKQREIYRFLDSTYLKKEQDKPYKKGIHRHGYYGICLWSRFEKIRYLEGRINERPQNFSISQAEFLRKKQEYIDNQPVIFTWGIRERR